MLPLVISPPFWRSLNNASVLGRSGSELPPGGGGGGTPAGGGGGGGAPPAGGGGGAAGEPPTFVAPVAAGF